MENIYVIGLDMDDKKPEDIARDAANQIGQLFDKLVEEQNKKKEEKPNE